jgi:hypothetical protein
VRLEVLDLSPQTYVAHRLHADDRMWLESNCAADLWIEVLHALGLEPLASMGCLLSAGFDGEQWRMFKFHTEDVRRLYGIDAYEINLWRRLPFHLADQIALGRMVTIDVDAWWLPDTTGLTYRSAHQKTTIAVQMIDVEEGRIGYFHNRGYYELGGEDYDRLINDEAVAVIPPYAEAIDIQRLHRSDDLRSLARDLAREHLNRSPDANPVAAMCKQIDSDLPWLKEGGLDTYHRYAFGSIRQCGSNAELAADYVLWLAGEAAEQVAEGGVRPSEVAAESFLVVSKKAKALEFIMARALRGRQVTPGEAMAEMEAAWAKAVDATTAELNA